MAFDLSTAKPVQAKSEQPGKTGFDLSTAKPIDASGETDEQGFQVGEMVSNIPGSAAKMAGNIYQAVTSPIETGKAVGKSAAGALFKANEILSKQTPEFLDFMSKPIGGGSKIFGEEYEPYADSIKQAMLKRYGSVDKLKNTIEQDPVGFAVDLSAVLAPISSTASAAVNPINAAINTGKYAAGKIIPKNLPKTMYESVAKFGTTIPKEKRAAMVDTALKYEIMPTSKGVAKLEGMIGGFNKQIDDLISSATASGESIPASAVYKHLKSLRQKKGGMSLDAPEDLQAINKVVSKFQAHLKKKGKSRLTPAELQELKVNAYKSINWDAKRMTGTPIKEDTYKAVARGAKEGVEQMVPGVKGVNKSLGELYELQPHLQRAANRIENKNIISLQDAPQVLAGSVAGGPAGAWLGAIVSFLGKDRIKAVNAVRLQRLVNNANFRQFLNNNPNISQAELIAIISGRQELPTGNDSPP